LLFNNCFIPLNEYTPSCRWASGPATGDSSNLLFLFSETDWTYSFIMGQRSESASRLLFTTHTTFPLSSPDSLASVSEPIHLPYP